MARHHGSRGIRVSHLQKSQIDAIKSFYNQIVAPRVTAMRDTIIGDLPTISAVPDAKPLVDALGPGAFDAFGGLIAVGLQLRHPAVDNDCTNIEYKSFVTRWCAVAAFNTRISTVC
jgi:hypothetical protein